MARCVLACGIFLGGQMATGTSAEAADVWAFTATNGDRAYVMTETVYNDGANFGCKVKLYYSRDASWHTDNFYFGLDEYDRWFAMRNGHYDTLTGVTKAIFDVARQYR